MVDRPRDDDPRKRPDEGGKRRRRPLRSSGDLPAPIQSEESLDDSLGGPDDTQDLLDQAEALIGEDPSHESATLVDLAEGPDAEEATEDTSADPLDEDSLAELAATTEMAAHPAPVHESGSWVGTDTQGLDEPGFDETSEDSAATQSISGAMSGDLSATPEWPGDLHPGRDDPDRTPLETTPGSTTSYDFNEEPSSEMMGIVLEESREFPELDPDRLPDPTGPLFPDAESTGDTSQEIDELLGAEVSEAVRLGVKALRRGQRDKAMVAFERALHDDPDDPMAQAYLRLAQELYVRELLPGASLSSVPRLRVGRKMLMILALTPEDGAVLSLIDGATTLEGLEMLLAHMDREAIYRCLASALENGLIEFMT